MTATGAVLTSNGRPARSWRSITAFVDELTVSNSVQRRDVLTVRGCVPTFYLKQVLQTMLKELNGVGRVDNQVDVVCSSGLSSVRNG